MLFLSNLPIIIHTANNSRASDWTTD